MRMKASSFTPGYGMSCYEAGDAYIRSLLNHLETQLTPREMCGGSPRLDTLTDRLWSWQKCATRVKHSQCDQASGQDAPRLNSIDTTHGYIGNTDPPGIDCPVSSKVRTLPTNQLATVFATTSEFACAAMIIRISFDTLPIVPSDSLRQNA
jgi:hypothetical protein